MTAYSIVVYRKDRFRGYVAKPESVHDVTPNLKEARTWTDKSAADFFRENLEELNRVDNTNFKYTVFENSA